MRKERRMKAFVTVFISGLLLAGIAQANIVDIYQDAAPNKYGSPAYPAWEAAAKAAAAAGTFVNMANGVNPGNIGTTDFEIEDGVVYSFGDLGKRLTWVYYIDGETVASLAGRIQVSLFNTWDGVTDDFYLDYYGSTWLVPSSLVNYGNGVIGMAGMAWWGAYGTNTQADLDADLAAWGQVPESWTFTVKLDNTDYAITGNRLGAVVPAPGAALLVLIGMPIIGWVKRRIG